MSASVVVPIKRPAKLWEPRPLPNNPTKTDVVRSFPADASTEVIREAGKAHGFDLTLDQIAKIRWTLRHPYQRKKTPIPKGALSRTDFVRSQPAHLKGPQIVAAGNASPHAAHWATPLDLATVHRVRHAMRSASPKPKRSGRSGARVERPERSVSEDMNRRALYSVILTIGIEAAELALADLRAMVDPRR